MSSIAEVRISALIPMYNAARFIDEALASVAAQTRPVQQVIVVDDGSTDAGAERVARHPGVILVRQAKAGITAALNAGLARADGDFLVYLDADDRWTVDKTERQLQAMLAEPALGVVFGLARRFITRPDGTEQPLDVLPGVSRPGGMFRRAMFTRLGGAWPEGDGHDFMEWYARAQEAGVPMRTLAHVMFERRIHGANDGLCNRANQHRAYFASIRSALLRRRAAEQGKVVE